MPTPKLEGRKGTSLHMSSSGQSRKILQESSQPKGETAAKASDSPLLSARLEAGPGKSIVLASPLESPQALEDSQPTSPLPWLEVLPHAAACFHRTQFRLLGANSRFRDWFFESFKSNPGMPETLLEQIGEDRIRAAMQEARSPDRPVLFGIEFKPAAGGRRMTAQVRIASADAWLRGTSLIFVEDISEIKKKQALGESVARMQDENIKQLAESRSSMGSVLDHLPEAFLIFGRDLKIIRSFSGLSKILFPEGAKNHSIRKLLSLEEPRFTPFFEILFHDIDPVLLDDLSPQETQIGDRTISIRFVKLMNEKNETQIMCILDDVTEVRLLQRRIQERDLTRNRILNAVMYREPFTNLAEKVRGLRAFAEEEQNFKRMIHAAKSNLDFFFFQDLARACHEWESLQLQNQHYNIDQAQELARKIERGLSRFISEQSEILRMDANSEKQNVQISIDDLRQLKEKLELRTEPQEVVQRLEGFVEVSPKQAFSWLGGIWNSTLEALEKKGKPIQFENTGARIAPYHYSELFSLLPLIVRNAADHGIEQPKFRQDIGKPVEGSLSLRLEEIGKSHGRYYRLCIHDDGDGIAWDTVRKKADERGEKEVSSWAPQRLLSFLLSGGVSTRNEATLFSGRGLGLNAIKVELDRIGGTLEVESTRGEGTCFLLEFPKIPAFDEGSAHPMNSKLGNDPK